MEKNFILAICQMDVVKGKELNLKKAEEMLREAAEKADVVVLPEMFNCPYNTHLFETYSEVYPGVTNAMLSRLAKELNVYIIGGSVPELFEGKLYNTCYSYSKEGKMIGKHRKVHLFDVDIEGGITFKESDTLKAGDEVTVIETEFCKIGVAICYDMRFPELMRSMIDRGAEVIIVPAAFNTVTGPIHWRLTARMRAIDNQVYFSAISPSRSKILSYKAYGHSLVVDPWGEVVIEADEDESILYAEICSDRIRKIRNELPLLNHRRKNVY